MRDTVYGAGHFLGSSQTLELMQTEYLYPDLSDRRVPDEWESGDKTGIYQRARDKAKEMLCNYYPEYIKPDVDKKIRDKFDIRIAPEEIKLGNGRW
ncbi:MAG: trimethylamine methyltransferase family protein [Planctomycetota bacterium]|nr:trimethylamine methyltransferase family protein [Planctomycetota bacterium]